MRVSVNSYYRFEPVSIDVWNPPHGTKAGILAKGDTVQVKNLPGCPRANTMGHCHIVTTAGTFAGLVCCNSLVKLDKAWRS